MFWSAALFGATVRVLRAVAGRRALHVTLLVGGVFALGLLCGQRAQAAESVPSAVTSAEAGPTDGSKAESATGSAAGSLTSPAVGPPVGPAVSPATRMPGAAPASKPAAGHRANGLAEILTGGLHHGFTPVTQGLRDGARRVTDGLEQGTEHLQDELGERLGGMPSEANSVPPCMLPSATTLPALTHLPLLPLPLPLTLPAPVTDAPAPGGPVDQAPAGGSEGDASSTGTSDDTHTAHAPYAQAAPAPATWHRAHGQRPASDANVAAPAAPFQHPADGEPDGMLGNRAATDGAGSRYGDALALTPAHRAPLVLVSGAAARVDVAETQGRYRDIPVSPA